MRVSAHLGRCWSCRRRQAELEEQARLVSGAFQERRRDVATSLWAAESIQTFRLRRAAVEAAPLGPPMRALRPVWAAGLAATLFAAALSIAVWVTGSRPQPAPPDSARLIASAVAAENALTRELLHQSIRVEVTQSRPKPLRSTGRLDLWSDMEQNRFACRWQNRDRLVYAAWRNGAGRQSVYGPSGAPARNAAVILADLVADAAELRDLESAFFEWLASRRWEPVFLSADLAVIASREGVAVRAELLRDGRGAGQIRLTGRRELGGRAVEFVVEVDPATARPVLQRLRYTGPGRAGEIALIMDRVEVLNRRDAPAGLFEPDPWLAPSSRALPLRRPPPARLPPMVPAVPEPDDIAEREIEVHLALHRAGACRGEQIVVAVASGGRVRVYGVAESESRKRELERVLGELPDVDMNLVVAAPAASAPDFSATPELPDQVVESARLPIQNQLEEYFGKLGEQSQVPARIAALANEATSISSALTAEAWALKRLAADFPPAKQRRLRAASRFVLESMTREHTAAIRERAGRAEALLAPFFAAGPSQGAPPVGSPTAGWRQAVEELLAAAERIDRITRALFTGRARSPGDFVSGGDLFSEVTGIGQRALRFEQWLAAAGLREQPESQTGPVAEQAARQEGEEP